MKKQILHLFVLGLLVLPMSAGAIYDPEAETSDTDGMQNRARIQMNTGEAEPMLLMEGSEANDSASETAIGRVRENWQNRVEKLKAQRDSKKNKKADKEQYREQMQTELHAFQGEMKDAVKERYENWQNTLDKKFDKWEARVEKAKSGENSEEIKFLQTEISRLKADLQGQLISLEAGRQAIEALRADSELWVAAHQAEWQSHKNNLRTVKDNLSALNGYLRQLKDLLQ
jgi:chromosome segregation ATPase